MRQEHKGFLYAGIAALLNAWIAILVKMAGEVPNEVLVFSRFLISFILFLPIFFRHKSHLSFKYFSKHVFRAVSGMIGIYCYYFALETLPVANAVTLASTMPLFTPLVIWVWLHKVISKKRLFGALLGFMGVLFMLSPTQFTLNLASFAALLTGLSGAISFVGIRQLSKLESTWAILFYYFGFACVISFVPMLYAWTPIQDPFLWLYILLIGSLATFFQYFMTRAFSLAPSSQVSVSSYLTIFFGGWFGWWIWGEIPTAWAFTGMALTIAGGVVALLDQTPPRDLLK